MNGCCEYSRKHLGGFDKTHEQEGSMSRYHRWPVAGWGLLLALCLSVLLACGYQLAGSGELPKGVNTIAVQVLANHTAESGLETTITNAVIDELTRRRQDLVVGVERADGILSGTINRLTTSTSARSDLLTAVERRLIVTVSFVLKDPSGKVLWQGRQLSAEQAYAVGESKAATEMNRRLAIGIVAQRLAEYLFERLTDSF
jgi:outer membrane lipopolysaccharide assembly protein LptE/RlpB